MRKIGSHSSAVDAVRVRHGIEVDRDSREARGGDIGIDAFAAVDPIGKVRAAAQAPEELVGPTTEIDGVLAAGVLNDLAGATAVEGVIAFAEIDLGFGNTVLYDPPN